MANGPVPTYAAYMAGCPFPEAFSGIAQSTVELVLARKTDLLVSALGDRAKAPIISWDGACDDCVCALAARTLMGYRGYDSSAGNDAEIVKLAEEAEKFRQSIIGKTEHPVFVDSHLGYVPDAPRISSSATSDAWVTARRRASRCC
jgi:hypothetical protein